MRRTESEPDLRPRCPKCGEPAREIAGVARVVAQLHIDGSPGRILRTSRFKPEESYYLCGANHRWPM